MPATTEELARLVDMLNHPDAIRQREIMDRLIALGAESVGALAANLEFAEPAAREALVRVLGEIGDDAALLPLMRFAFDTRGEIESSDARGLALQAIMHLAGPEHADRLFDFLMDMRGDEDPFVRGWTLEAMGKFGDRRAEPIIAEALEDEHEFVRERAQAGLDRLRADGDGQGLDRSDVEAAELLRKIRGSEGGERAFWLGALQEREDAFELTARLIQEGDRGTMIGLKLMGDLDDPRARRVGASHYRATNSATERAICLRLMARHLRSDATDEEADIIRAGLHHDDAFVRMAALAAAAVSGREELVRRAIESIEGRDLDASLNVAEALAEGLDPKMKRFLPELRDALEFAHRTRKRRDLKVPALLEANLLRALGQLAPELVVGRSDLQRDALRSLKGARAHWPVLVSALRLLRDLCQDQAPLAPDERWRPSETMPLVDLIDHPDERVRARVLDLTAHGAPEGLTAIAAGVERVIHDDSLDISDQLIPLLMLAGGERARGLLKDLTQSPDEDTRLSAEAALRKLRNDQSVIDAKFTRPPE